MGKRKADHRKIPILLLAPTVLRSIKRVNTRVIIFMRVTNPGKFLSLSKKLAATLQVCFVFLLQQNFANGQSSQGLSLTNSFNQQAVIYNPDTIIHTTWKPIVYEDTGATYAAGTWLSRKFFHEHLLQIKQPGFNINADLIFDEYIGSSNRKNKTPSNNTRGYEVTGSLGNKFYFETDIYETQARYSGYVDSFIRGHFVIPGGLGGHKNPGDGAGFDFSASKASLIYLPSKHVMFNLGYGKNFIGDGYRSLLLSDWAFNYPYFRTAVTFGKFQYNVMWSQYISDRQKIYNNNLGYYRKWSQTFLVNYQATKRFSISVFETVQWPDQDSMRRKDISPWVASPVIFLHGDKSPNGVPNNVITGLNLKYRVAARTDIYGQVVYNNKTFSDSLKNRYGIQAGVRSGDAFGVKNLNVILEANFVKPYSYATNLLNTNYAHNNEPLAHPFGANFREGIFVADYTFKKWYFRAESFIAEYGADSTGSDNYGHNIFKPVNTQSVTGDMRIGQGLKTTIFYADAKLAYIINPASNLRIEGGFTFRNEKSSQFSFRDRMVYIGVRMSFRKVAFDF